MTAVPASATFARPTSGWSRRLEGGSPPPARGGLGGPRSRCGGDGASVAALLTRSPWLCGACCASMLGVELLPLDETRRRLRVLGQAYVGVHEIPIERIVGSVDRDGDFDRQFRPRTRLSRRRLANLRRALPDGVMPAIEVFEVGGAYFVEDGHHRVAVARERGAEFIDAEVTRLQTNYEVPPGVDVSRLVHTDQQRILLQETGLGRARPDVVIEFTLLAGYAQLSDIKSGHTGTTSPGSAAPCRRPRQSPPTGMTPSTCRLSEPPDGRDCRSGWRSSTRPRG
jgi:hypothetical protein